MVIFHFIDDFLKPNLRFKQSRIRKREDLKLWVLDDRGVVINSDKTDDTPWKSVMTWAPSHVEVITRLDTL